MLLLLGLAPLCAISQGDSKYVSVRLVAYMVRKGDNIENIAARFQIPAQDILKPNKLSSKKFVAYPGKILLIPVRVRAKVWDPMKDLQTLASLPSEDRGHGLDYEIITSADDYSLSDDFININDAVEDSLEFANVGEHINKINRQIKNLQHKVDSIKKNEFTFTFDESDKSAVLERMKQARDRYYLEGPLGKKVDSLNMVESRLLQRRQRLRTKITEYEDLVDNADYNQRNFEKNARALDTKWAAHLQYQSRYLNGKLQQVKVLETPAPQLAKAPETNVSILAKAKSAERKSTASDSKNNTASLTSTSKTNNSSSAKSDQSKSNNNLAKTMVKSADAKNSSTPATSANKKAIAAKAEKTKQEINADIVRESPDGAAEDMPRKQMIDYAMLPKQSYSGQIYLPKAKTTLSYISDIFPKMSVAKTQMAASPAREAIRNGMGDTGATAFVSSSDFEPYMLKQSKNTFEDFALAYKPDTNTAKNLKEKDIQPISGKKKKYLIPVDTTTRIKGDFYMIRARQELEKGDFKNGEKYLSKSLEINPNNAAGWMLHADIYLSVGVTEQALKDYLIASEIDSTNPKVYYNMALVYESQKDYKKSYSNFTRAIDLNEKYILAYMGRASLLLDENRADEAIDDYNKVLGINSAYAAAIKARGIARMQAREFNKAISDFNKYLESDAKDGYVLYQRGLAKIFSNDLLKGCLDLSAARDNGFKEADKAMKKFCQ